MQTFPIRLIPWFFLLKAAVILASWGWNKLGVRPQEHRIWRVCSHCRQAQACTVTWSHCMVIALLCSWSASGCNICWLLFIVCRTLTCLDFFSCCCTPGRCGSCFSTNTDKSVPSPNNGQLAPGVTVKSLNWHVGRLEWNRENSWSL